ncbi:hypothetical protein [Kitasatospora sp. NPDC057223]|uniref:hypothetical protein n=1 Tax=Kitasatospora sp. NPDC057223 TaxID=3346055 RepID=UPI00363B1864
MTVRAAYQDREGALGGPPWATVAPPPLSGPPPEPETGAGVAVLGVIGGLLIVVALLGIASDGLPALGSAYETGQAFGKLLFPLLVIGAALLRHGVVRARYNDRLAVHRAQTALWKGRQAVWEAARLCRRCRVAYFPAGVLRADFPASPPIPLEQFAVMVVTMAERAYGSAPLLAGGPPAALV